MEVKTIKGKSELNAVVMREGYCCDCDNNPEIPLPDAAKMTGNKCNKCWCSNVKPNWTPKGEG